MTTQEDKSDSIVNEAEIIHGMLVAWIEDVRLANDCEFHEVCQHYWPPDDDYRYQAGAEWLVRHAPHLVDAKTLLPQVNETQVNTEAVNQ